MLGKYISERTIFFRNFVFGVEDSLASTVGLMSGIAVAGLSQRTIITTGLILIAVESFSMAVGSYLSEQYTQNYAEHREMPPKRAIMGSIIMFATYLLTGFLPVFPYAFLDVKEAFPVSVVLSLLALLMLAVFTSRITQSRLIQTAVRMVLIGGIAVMVGAIVGRLAS